MPTVTVSEKVTGGPVKNEFKIDLAADRVTVRELIRKCVFHHAELLNNGAVKTTFFFAPTPDEAELNSEKPLVRRKIDPERQFSLACEAFASNKVLLLLDGSQETELDKEIPVCSESRITFLQLVPLVGG